ncbi:hypothetical protein [Luxibacter massiliensis]|uniref:hypothetical protein n=1 Tax=Luxibacter massiliensis TaxID=2219695 RepID=UPI000F06FD69|nr:hypothetical protein [Luxibacter massiliensis]
MWKESDPIGIDHIDRQHKELFPMAGQLVQSALSLCELTNISCGNATIQLSQKKMDCNVTTPHISETPAFISETSSIVLDSDYGRMAVAILSS